MIRIGVWLADYAVEHRARKLGRALNRSEELRVRLVVALVFVSPLLVVLAAGIINALRHAA